MASELILSLDDLLLVFLLVSLILSLLILFFLLFALLLSNVLIIEFGLAATFFPGRLFIILSFGVVNWFGLILFIFFAIVIDLRLISYRFYVRRFPNENLSVDILEAL